MSEYVDRLRNPADVDLHELMDEAADRIEELEAELDDQRQLAVGWAEAAEGAEAERDRAVAIADQLVAALAAYRAFKGDR